MRIISAPRCHRIASLSRGHEGGVGLSVQFPKTIGKIPFPDSSIFRENSFPKKIVSGKFLKILEWNASRNVPNLSISHRNYENKAATDMESPFLPRMKSDELKNAKGGLLRSRKVQMSLKCHGYNCDK